ncbi:helix-turn-helix domain-containing protein [Niveispirillum irakense]|uniref:helix-turn-helix domain-containing protein n=1 Tax=Niveispirillum irakense TaxID=34011 RepID=UPI000412F495|nr:helix-turn-helix domain-containing protein [Niveispirillum irakense]
MGENYSHLSLAEQRVIDETFQALIPVREIAARLGRHRGTIHRQINRNFYHTRFRDRFGNDYQGYYCMMAKAMAGRWRRRGRLRAGWSPQ